MSLIILYCFALLLVANLLYRSVRRSEFGVLLFISEFLFFGLGLCFYPILFMLGLISPGPTAGSFLQLHHEPGIITALHVLAYAAFAYLGYDRAIKRDYSINSRLFTRLRKTFENPNKLFVFLIVFGIVVYGVFIYLVGLDVALINAFAARSGDMEGFGDDVKFLFLKTVAGISLYAVCFLPWLLQKKKNVRDWIFICFYFLLVLFAYLNSISRSLLLASVVAPYFVYARQKLSLALLFKSLLITVFGVVVLIYGKTFGHYFSMLVSGETAELGVRSSDDGYFMELFQNVEFTWFSIEAGIINFFYEGPIFPQDLYYSLFGFIPSKILEYFELGNFYYGSAATRLPCVNTEIFGVEPCTVPPLWPGYSAYLLPIAGGMIFGFLKFYVFGRIEMMWLLARKIDYSLTWIPYFIFILMANFFSLIPTVIAPTTFVLLLIFFYVTGRRILLGLQTKRL